MALLDTCIITNSEEELIQYALESLAALGDLVGIVSLVDNNSADATLEIVDSFKDRLNLVIQHEWHHSNHGKLRNMALEPCTSDWVYYIDSDESTTNDFSDWLRSGDINRAPFWRFYKYATIFDCYHYVDGGNGPTERLFRRFPGVSFPQDIHTVPTHPGLSPCLDVPNVLMFDHTPIKSKEALWAKGARYQWGFRSGIAAIGPVHEYIGRVDGAIIDHPDRNREFPEDIKRRIFCGPGFKKQGE